MHPADLIPFAVVFAVAVVATVIGWFVNPVATEDFLRARYEFGMKLWSFWGPRVTDRTFIAAVGANVVALGFVSSHQAELWQLAIWGGANLLFPIWDNHPAGERVLANRDAGDVGESVGH